MINNPADTPFISPVQPVRSHAKALAIAWLLVASIAPASAHAGQWSSDLGADSAAKLIAKCLDADPRGRCSRVAFEACDREYGTISQQNLNGCASYSRRAWEQRLKAIEAQLFVLLRRTEPPVYAPKGVDLGAQLRESIRLWREWNRADCAMQSASSAEGSMYPLELDLCLSNHAAIRSGELTVLHQFWNH